MNNSGIFSTLSSQVSGVLRYERVARLEAVLALREKQKRSLRWRLLFVGLGLGTVATVLILAILTGA